MLYIEPVVSKSNMMNLNDIFVSLFAIKTYCFFDQEEKRTNCLKMSNLENEQYEIGVMILNKNLVKIILVT